MSVDPMAYPGRRLYEQIRALRRAKRAYMRRRVTAIPVPEATVLQFPSKEEAPDGQPQ